MKKEAILHIPLSQYAYATGSKSIMLRLRCAKDDIQRCFVFYGDRVDQNPVIRVERKQMRCVASDDLFDYYEAELDDTYPRLCYYFRLEDKEEAVYYYERGFCQEIGKNRTEYFQFPYIRREDILNVPDWAEDLIMYQIFPDSFATAKRSISKTSSVLEAETEHNRICSENRLGGTLQGITENIDYISGLGVNCIYLNPIFLANSYHKYDTADYYRVDACMGTLEDLKLLVKKCHEHQIRVILDGVFNHCGPDFFAFRDVLEKGKASEYYDWFYDMPEPIRYEDPPGYAAFAYVKEMPKLNTSNPKLEQYLIRVGTYWMEEADIDGWRLDVANEVNHDFWRHFKTAVRNVKPDAFLIGEIWEDAGVWLQGDQFDSTMNYRFSYLCRDFFAKRTMTVSQFDSQIQKMIMRYPLPISLAQMNFLDTHDVPRFLSYCEGNRRRMELAYFYLFMGYGIPSIFYGDECYIEGETENAYRSPMPWGVTDSCYELFQKLIGIRRAHSSIRNGSYQSVLCEDEQGLYFFLRKNEEDMVLVLINNSDKEQKLDLKLWDKVEKKIGHKVENKVNQIAPTRGVVYEL